MEENYRICSRCIMDNASDPYISFNEKESVIIVLRLLQVMLITYFPNEQGIEKLNDLIVKLKREGREKI